MERRRTSQSLCGRPPQPGFTWVLAWRTEGTSGVRVGSASAVPTGPAGRWAPSGLASPSQESEPHFDHLIQVALL